MEKIFQFGDSPIERKEIIYLDQKVQVLTYLPIKDKTAFVSWMLSKVFDEEGVFSPVRYAIYFSLGLIKWYTDISVDTENEESIEELFDKISQNELAEIIFRAIPLKEGELLIKLLKESISSVERHISSFVGQVANIQKNIADTDLKLQNMAKDLEDPEKIGFLKEVLQKMG